MRAIKFRCWNGETMVSPDFIRRDGIACWSENSILTYSENIMQFTGLKDKNGKEIYEGDIVNLKDHTAHYVCQWREELAAFGYKCLVTDEWRNMKEPACVIGNIFENYELLGAK